MCDGPHMPRILVMECPQGTSKSVDFGTGPESPSEQETPGADAAQGTEIRHAPAEALCPPGAEGAGKVGKRRRSSPRFRRFVAEYATPTRQP